ncbi:MarR family transcriptional regulator, partial [Pseudomonas sp.]
MLDALGLTYPQYLAMLVLWEWQESQPEQPTVKALGERLMLDSGTLTPLLKRIEQMGLVRRRRAAQDEREVHLSLSAEGLALNGRASELRQQLICASGLDLNELQPLQAGLEHLLARLTTLGGSAPSGRSG